MYEYWFMIFVAILVATIAMLVGVGGALLFSPIFIILFPLVGVTVLTPADALAAALITEVFGFASGLFGYGRKKLIDLKTASTFIMIGIPAAIIGTYIKRNIDGSILILFLGIGLILMGLYTLRSLHNKEHEQVEGAEKNPRNLRRLVDVDQNIYEYVVCRHNSGRILALAGGISTGLLSVGIGETTVSTLRVKCGLPMKVASGTSVLVVTIVVLTSSLTDIALVGIESVPWTLLIFTIPGVLIGGQIGPRLASKISPETGEKILLGLFFSIGLIMILVYFFN